MLLYIPHSLEINNHIYLVLKKLKNEKRKLFLVFLVREEKKSSWTLLSIYVANIFNVDFYNFPFENRNKNFTISSLFYCHVAVYCLQRKGLLENS